MSLLPHISSPLKYFFFQSHSFFLFCLFYLADCISFFPPPRPASDCYCSLVFFFYISSIFPPSLLLLVSFCHSLQAFSSSIFSAHQQLLQFRSRERKRFCDLLNCSSSFCIHAKAIIPLGGGGGGCRCGPHSSIPSLFRLGGGHRRMQWLHHCTVCTSSHCSRLIWTQLRHGSLCCKKVQPTSIAGGSVSSV